MFGLSLETIILILIILIMTIIFIYQYLNDFSKRMQIASQAPAILTTTGIFATFLAIAIGLFHFDTQNIQQGVPALLNSLKTAFWASVVGVGSAILIKGLSYMKPPETEHNLEVMQLIDELRHLHTHEVQANDQNQAELIKELKLLRADNDQHFKRLSEIQEDALLKLIEMNHKSLIESLEDIIKNFNHEISQQLGGNFKELNESLGKVLVWQENYQHFIDTTSDYFAEILDQMNDTIEQFNTLVNQSKIFVENANEFSNITRDIHETIRFIQDANMSNTQYLEKLVTTISSHEQGLPSIEQKLLSIVHQMDTATQENNRLLQRATQETTEQVKALNEGMAIALNTALNQITGNLAALSEKFAYDYAPIANHLERIVKISQQIR